MAVTTTKTNKPLNPRGNDQSPKGYNRAELYSGKALDFDGVNDEISIGSANFLGFGTGSFSFAWYINSSESVDFQSLIDYRHTSGIGVLLDHRLGGIGGALQTAEGNFAFDITSATSSVSGDVFDGKWHHVVFVADRSTSNTRVTFYIDGQLHYYDVNTNAQTSTIEDGQQMYIGGQGGTQYIDASLSSFKAFNTALTAAQVADLYNNPEKIVPTGVADSALKLWLPMQEGAGTTAYDGSGNGNHGTISGATWTHGIGAPVSQTAVIDWNKGTNLLVYTEQFDDSNWAKANVTITANATTAPDGQSTADEVNASSSFEISDQFVNVASATHIASFWFKNGTINQIFLEIIGGTPGILGQATINLSTGVLSDQVGSFTPTIEAYADGWYRVAVGDLGNASIASPSIKIKQSGSNTGTFYIWGAQIEAADSLGAYIPNHTGTPITSDVLLPQGLTTGRDITGVNLFENVRKQSALNLDGNSWAEVHDNASLDFGTDSFSLEAWAKVKYVNQGSSVNVIMTLGNEVVSTNSSGLSVTSSDTVQIWYSANSSASSTLSEGDWVHIVGTYDETNATLYVNGSQVDQDARTAASITNTLVKEIGRDTSGQRYYNDQIAQPRIYNRALTAEEVARNYAAHKSIYTNS